MRQRLLTYITSAAHFRRILHQDAVSIALVIRPVCWPNSLNVLASFSPHPEETLWA